MNRTREIIYVFVITILIAASAQLYYTNRWLPAHDIVVYYNHDRQLDESVIASIRNADKFVYFAVYTFTRQNIKDALLGAKYRGLVVVGVTDRDQYIKITEQKKIIDDLRTAGIPVYEQDHSGIMHLKVLVTDKTYVSGSYNWTTSANTINDEVLEIGSNPEIRQQYENILKKIIGKYAPAV